MTIVDKQAISQAVREKFDDTTAIAVFAALDVAQREWKPKYTKQYGTKAAAQIQETD